MKQKNESAEYFARLCRVHGYRLVKNGPSDELVALGAVAAYGIGQLVAAWPFDAVSSTIILVGSFATILSVVGLVADW